MNLTSLFKLALLSIFVISCGSNQNDASAQESNTNAKLTLTEYSDYQCPACAYFYPIVDSLKQTYGNDLEVVYKDFPLNSHQYAALAARAAEAAKNQGKFLEMHNMLFENQRQWASGDAQSRIIGYAKQIGLDMNRFEQDLNAAETQQAVMEEKQEGVQMGVDSTPTFFINGEKLQQNPPSFQDFKALIDVYMKDTN
ncbi:thioredoxin domain-containing protein [Balneolaceae bacterium YR4-1]|uniref:Thioredoxin domain-containing protein n=1 Tax=Halalkalibaculum roseum TaxID=2709311 RepID=A0A6M1SXC1_9BACT|nr:thioredoxin domain-containing protein [Halalkalibaculum roseum]NGP77642.1 thioredoxin domain-containing protein [Halalkalibaculum roseum]